MNRVQSLSSPLSDPDANSSCRQIGAATSASSRGLSAESLSSARASTRGTSTMGQMRPRVARCSLRTQRETSWYKKDGLESQASWRARLLLMRRNCRAASRRDTFGVAQVRNTRLGRSLSHGAKTSKPDTTLPSRSSRAKCLYRSGPSGSGPVCGGNSHPYGPKSGAAF